MSIRTMAFTALVPMLLATASAHAANPSTAQRRSSVFDPYTVTAVQPYRAQISNGFDTYTALRGAEVFVQAREGLTAEWLDLSLRKALAQANADRPAVAKLKVDVVSAGPGFWVFLTTDDEHSAGVVLNWARNIGAAQHAQVK